MIRYKPHTQILFFSNGARRPINNIIMVERGQWFHLYEENGTEWIVNPDNVLCVKVLKPSKINE